jgi:NADH-quinone oxidoreductase subunit N
MWFDTATAHTDTPTRAASLVAYACAAFAFPGVLIALIWLDPAATLAAKALALR